MRNPLPAIFTGAAIVLLAGSAVPYRWTHDLGPGCNFRPRNSLALIGRATPTPADRDRQTACQHRRGLKSSSAVKKLLRRWPHENPLPAPAHPADVPPSPRR